ncbi:MAG TPA: tail fiber domain-containing protein, partial [Candidatus Paceibacterota bacterium]|nr:tail fiber domain-containing protein [Candidatus Paceibacterota bacterium]
LADGTNTFTLGVDDSDGDKFKISTTALGTNDRFVIDGSGNVSIGDASNYTGIDPDGDLQFQGTADYLVAGNEYAFRFVTDEDYGLKFDSTNGVYAFMDSTAVRQFSINADTGATAIGNTNTGFMLEVGSASIVGVVARFVNSTGTCDINPTTTSLSCSSDATLKRDIETYTNALDRINQLRGVTFSWLSDTAVDPRRIGFIAQEVESVIPELVATDAAGKKSVAYANLAPVLVEAVKELDLKISSFDSLQAAAGNSLLADGMAADNFTEKVKLSFIKLSDVLLDMKLHVQELFTKKVTTSELCLDDLCVTKSELQELLNLRSEGTPPPPPASDEVSNNGDFPPTDDTPEDSDQDSGEEPTPNTETPPEEEVLGEQNEPDNLESGNELEASEGEAPENEPKPAQDSAPTEPLEGSQ